MKLNFKDKVVLVTGAGAGIGEETARLYAEAGAKVCLNSRSDSAALISESLNARGWDTCFIKADVSDYAQVEAMADSTARRYGKLDILVNNAGIVAGGNVEETSLEIWDEVMRVNVTGVFYTCKCAMKYLRQTKGTIVNVSSLVAVKGIPNRAVYSASKGALLSLSSAMAADYIDEGIRVNCICPGTVLTPSLKQRIASAADPEQAMKDFVARQPLGRLGRPEEVAAAILFASCEEAGFLDGSNIRIDGGASM